VIINQTSEKLIIVATVDILLNDNKLIFDI